MQGSIHFDHELIEQEDLDGFIERGELRTVGQSPGQAHAGVAGDHRAWDDHQSMEGDDRAGQSLRVREPRDHLHEARSLGRDRVGDRLVASGRLEGAPQLTARGVASADDRLELKNGAVRVIDAGGNLLPTPFATVTVQGAGSHQGLIAMALDPQFGATGHVYVLFSAPADMTHAGDHMRLERFTDVMNVGTNETVLLDNIPTASINNGCDLVFGQDGNLFVSLGDSNVAANAQDPLSLCGKVLRMKPDGTIPSDNPDPLSYVFASGLRNTFGLAVHPLTGGLFGVDNGPAADDELNYVAAGKNFGWGSAVPIPGVTEPAMATVA